MAVDYNGAHSIKFTRVLNNEGAERHSWNDFKLIPDTRPYVPPSQPSINNVEIPGSNRTLDISTVTTRTLERGVRTGSWSFYIDHEHWPDWNTALTTLANYFDGSKFIAVLLDDDRISYSGRISLSNYSVGETFSKIQLSYTFTNEFDPNILGLEYTVPDGQIMYKIKIIGDSYPRLYRLLAEDTVYKFHVDWGDGVEEDINAGQGNYAVHYYKFGWYTITVTPDTRSTSFRLNSIQDKHLNFIDYYTLIEAHIGANAIKFNNGYIDGATFIDNRGLKKLSIGEGITELGFNMAKRCYALRNVKLPNSLKTIGDNAFTDCRALKNIDIPENVEKIDHHAFYGCSALNDVILPKRHPNELGEMIGGIKKIYEGTFQMCKSLTHIKVPYGVTDIETSAFDSCIVLSKVNLPNELETIGSKAFLKTAMKKIVIPNSVTSIGSEAFAECSLLKQIDFPPNISVASSKVAYRCKSLKKVVMASVGSIQTEAFAENPNLNYVFSFRQEPPGLNYTSFNKCGALKAIRVPYLCANAYRAANNWINFTTIISGMKEKASYEQEAIK